MLIGLMLVIVAALLLVVASFGVLTLVFASVGSAPAFDEPSIYPPPGLIRPVQVNAWSQQLLERLGRQLDSQARHGPA